MIILCMNYRIYVDEKVETKSKWWKKWWCNMLEILTILCIKNYNPMRLYSLMKSDDIKVT
jgi:hypothetical protein